RRPRQVDHSRFQRLLLHAGRRRPGAVDPVRRARRRRLRARRALGHPLAAQRMNFLSGVFHWLTTSANWTGSDGALVRIVAQLALSGAVILVAAVIGIGLGFF